MKQLAFLLYDNRSGSTLLSSLLNQFNLITVSQEIDFISQIIEYNKPFLNHSDIDYFINFLYLKTRINELSLSKSSLYKALQGNHFPISKQTIIHKIIDQYLLTLGDLTPVLVIKEVRALYHIPSIISYFPGAKFIFIIRDGRAVYNSKKKSISVITGKPMDSSVISAALNWKKKINLVKPFTDYTFTLKYEDLISNTEATLLTVINFLIPGSCPNDIIPSKNIVDYHSKIPGPYTHLHQNLDKPPDLSIATKWRQSLSFYEIYTYEFINRQYLEAFEYPIIALTINNCRKIKFTAACFVVSSIIQYALMKFRYLIASLIRGDLFALLKRKLFELRSVAG